jgi:hypothetical protein
MNPQLPQHVSQRNNQPHRRSHVRTRKLEVVQAHRYELLGTHGTVRATLAMDLYGNPELSMNDRQGRSRILVTLSDRGSPEIRLRGVCGQSQLLISESFGDSMRLTVMTDDGQCIEIPPRPPRTNPAPATPQEEGPYER